MNKPVFYILLSAPFVILFAIFGFYLLSRPQSIKSSDQPNSSSAETISSTMSKDEIISEIKDMSREKYESVAPISSFGETTQYDNTWYIQEATVSYKKYPGEYYTKNIVARVDSDEIVIVTSPETDYRKSSLEKLGILPGVIQLIYVSGADL